MLPGAKGWRGSGVYDAPVRRGLRLALRTTTSVSVPEGQELTLRSQPRGEQFRACLGASSRSSYLWVPGPRVGAVEPIEESVGAKQCVLQQVLGIVGVTRKRHGRTKEDGDLRDDDRGNPPRGVRRPRGFDHHHDASLHRGFLTPLFHISAVVGSPSAMMTPMQEAMGGTTSGSRLVPRRPAWPSTC